MDFPAARYLSRFFRTLKMDSEAEGHFYNVMLSETIKAFVSEPTKENAYEVYTTFFDIYRLGATERSFVDLLDTLRAYEENAAAVVEGQRDHYVHSVNVFLLGLCIYEQNRKFREAIARDNQKSKIRYCATDKEEFLLKWGIAALFHDIGYPMEIINRQVNSFISFVASDRTREIGPYVSFINYERLNRIVAPCGEDCPFSEKGEPFDPYKPTDLVAYGISRKIPVDPKELKASLDGFLGTMQRFGFVDHGFYSAIIVLKWYGEALLADRRDLRFYDQIVDAASAIFLHNAYKNVLQKEPFGLGPLSVSCFPLAYLLILCDEAQEWNRVAYGVSAKERIAIDDSYTEISDDLIKFHYITSKGTLNTQFLTKKEGLFYKLLEINEVFRSGVSVTANEDSGRLMEEVRASAAVPRLLAENIEILAKKIHADYNKVQLQRHPNKPLEHPTWESLPDTLKYSNIRQAYTITNKLRLVGCSVAPRGTGTPYELTNDEIEYLSIREHNLWVEERVKNGWHFGEKRDPENKTSPYILPYSELTEEIKELDRDTIRNIKPLLESIGLSIVRND